MPAPSVPAYEETASRAVLAGIAVGLAALVFLAYVRVLSHGFVLFDDHVYIFENPHVTRGLSWDGVRWAFAGAHAANWHPLTWLSHMLDCELFGLKPGAHHAVSVGLHAANAALLFLALRWMTRSVWPSALVAALFGLHPLRVESVAWAAERKDVLSGLFWMLTLLAYAWYAANPKVGRYLSVLILLALGLMAKPMLVSLPFVLLLLDFWPLGRVCRAAGARPGGAPVASPGTRSLGELMLEKAPMLALVVASSVITALAQRGAGAMSLMEVVPLPARLANAIVSYVAYLWATLWPLDLAFFYPHPRLLASHDASSLALLAAGAGVLLAAITAFVLRSWRRRPWLAIGWLWYAIALFPVIGVVQVGMQARADRYTYLPLIGIYVLIAWGARELVAKWKPARFAIGLTAGAVLLGLFTATWLQAGIWRDSRTLAEHAIRATRGNYVAHSTLGLVLQREGRLDEAKQQYEQALTIKPGDAVAHNNLGVVLQAEGRVDEAVTQFELALRSAPEYAEALNNLGAVLEKRGELAGAAELIQHALRLKPEYPDALYNLGVVLLRQGQPAAAVEFFERALDLRPQYAEPHNYLGSLLERQGDLAQAQRHFEAAVRIDPAFAEAHYNLGVVFARQQDWARAAAQFERALAARPDFEPARAGLARIRAMGGGS